MHTDWQAINKARVPDVMALLLIGMLVMVTGLLWLTTAKTFSKYLELHCKNCMKNTMRVIFMYQIGV
jgi:hypothetical protein